MAILDSPLMAEFIGFLKSNWTTNSSVDQRVRRLRQLVAMVRDVAEDRAALRGESLNAWLQQLRMQALRGQAVLDATSDATAVVGTARKLLAGVKALFVCSAEVDRLAQAVEELERLAGPGGDLDLFVKVLQLDAAPPAAMDLDTEEEAISGSRANSSPAMFPTPGIKRKRAGSSSVVDVDRDGDSVLRRTPDSKRRFPHGGSSPAYDATVVGGWAPASLVLSLRTSAPMRREPKKDPFMEIVFSGIYLKKSFQKRLKYKKSRDVL